MGKGSFGEFLRREREIREVSLNEVTVATRIPHRFLEAFESEDWKKLPGGAFNRGFVRSIARYLGLDEEHLLAEYDLAHGQQKIDSASTRKRPIPSPPKWLVGFALLVVLLGVAGAVTAGIYGWRRYAANRAEKPASALSVPFQPTATASLPNLTPESAASVAITSPLDLAVSTSAATRVRIVADGKVLLDAKLHAGETRHFSAGQRFEVTAGDASAVLLELNGQAMRPVGPAGASGTILLSQEDLRQAPGGNSQP
jgi:cytoskeleton protein RodZ